ncbi:MAG: hypothetical protein ACOH2M_08780, partial [Cypionkella sp.]
MNFAPLLPGRKENSPSPLFSNGAKQKHTEVIPTRLMDQTLLIKRIVEAALLTREAVGLMAK